MKTKYISLLICIIISGNVFSQKIIHATSTLVDIRDGGSYHKNYWTIMPEVRPDIYETPNKNDTVTFYTDIDSISFFVEADKTYGFIIVLNNKDSAHIQIKYVPGFLDLLKSAKDYNYSDNRFIPEFSYQSADDPNLKNLRKVFRLDSIAGNGNEISKMLNLMHWVNSTIQYDGSCQNPSNKNTIDLIKVCKAENRPLNCRMMATILNECCLSIGIKSRFITCMPKEINYNDCHVINMVYSNELERWVWLDPSYDLYVMDEKGELLGIKEVRERLISGKPLKLNKKSFNYQGNVITDKLYLESYMAKNLYRMECPLVSEYDTETKKEDQHVTYVELLPIDATNQSPQHLEKISERTGMLSTYYKTNNPDLFWKIPE